MQWPVQKEIISVTHINEKKQKLKSNKNSDPHCQFAQANY